MKRLSSQKGSIYRCPVCGAEICVLVKQHGIFEPKCCNVKMTRLRNKLVIYHCPICGAEIAVITKADASFLPRCCNTSMLEV